MSKSCNGYEKWLDRYQTGELEPEIRQSLESHLAACEACRQALEFRRRLTSQLAAEVAVPISLRSRVTDKIDRPAPRTWLERTLGDPKLKKTLLSTFGALAALIVGASLFPGSAEASPSPIDVFRAMHDAVQKKIDHDVVISYAPDYKIVLDGKSIATRPNETVVLDARGASKVLKKGEKSFKTIRFGDNKNFLVLVDRASPDKTYKVEVDPVSKLPKECWVYLAGKGKDGKSMIRLRYIPSKRGK
ncbi:anti-sigma factor family protein [Fimbriimonas ginsengisoli]|uniref:Putative zinc-finger domain-containing protein n=1 Tax=Fimbriimonas ginsengisoli Gsoil 348 TaxID=661478 RepID=A0A068NMJ1_FIMGI|nr:zf-HC2 domain-containing protein [Fimbriimonas ginsengisoli]AIE84676.1 hypothetical protein OP10G_1308 [Fimbriimonas ginsengisoli Gsoil 348]